MGASSDGKILWVEVLDSTGTQNSDAVTKIGGAIVSQVKNARNCGKYGENVISSIKNSGFTTAEVNAQISKFSKLGCTQSTIETLLKDAKCMFLGDDVLSFLGKQGGNQRLLAELVIGNGDDFTKALLNCSDMSDEVCELSLKYGQTAAVTSVLNAEAKANSNTRSECSHPKEPLFPKALTLLISPSATSEPAGSTAKKTRYTTHPPASISSF